MNPPARDRFSRLLKEAVHGGTLVKLTLGKSAGKDPGLVNLFVRPVRLNSGPQFALVWHYSTRDVTKNHKAEEALELIENMIGSEFLDAHLFTTTQNAQLETGKGSPRLRIMAVDTQPGGDLGNDRQKHRVIAAGSPWLRALGVTDDRGRPTAGMKDKFRQIEKFAELLEHMLHDVPLHPDRRLRIFDMGCGKGYLTFAISELLGDRADVCGVESRPDLVDFCRNAASETGFADRLSFQLGSIADTEIGSADVLIALHACDTATDDALAKGISAGASLLVVAPCCQKEVRPQLTAPPVLEEALRHGIFAERQAEFITDALRANLLEWAGYRTRVIEFISTEHTAKNIMIAASRVRPEGDAPMASRIRGLAAFYGIRKQALAAHLNFSLE